jgi:hypothetical protein
MDASDQITRQKLPPTGNFSNNLMQHYQNSSGWASAAFRRTPAFLDANGWTTLTAFHAETKR